MDTQGRASVEAVEFSADSVEDLEAVFEELRGVPGVQVVAVSAPIADGDQGSALEFLTVACSGGAITVVLEIVKTLVESRRPHFSLKFRRGGDRVELTSDNLDEVLPLLKELLGGP